MTGFTQGVQDKNLALCSFVERKLRAVNVRWVGVLIWIVEAIGLLNLISVSPLLLLMYFSRHTDVKLRTLSISSAILFLVYYGRVGLSRFGIDSILGWEVY